MSPTPRSKKKAVSNSIGERLEHIHVAWIYTFLAFLSSVLYINTIGHDFVLDDAIVISENSLTKQGVSGLWEIFTHDSFYGFFQEEGKDALVSGGRYRPLTQAMFAIEFELFGLNPVNGHLFNILWYCLCCCTVFHLLSKWLRRFPQATLIAFVAALLFTLHPIHTEVVANIKGRDEILALFLGLWSSEFALRSVHKKRLVNGLIAMVLYVLALMAKENALGFLAVVPLIALLLQQINYGQVLKACGPILFGLGFYLVLRFAVIGWSVPAEPPLELMNNPFVEVVEGSYERMTINKKVPTILYGLGKYLQLVVFPHPLTHDYYPRHIPIKQWNDLSVWVSILFIFGLLLLALGAIKVRPIASFGILYFFATLALVANIFFPVGTNLSERFLFMPSLGATLMLAWLFSKLVRRYSSLSWLVLLCLSGVAAFQTIGRNLAWKDNLTLFTTDAVTSANSAKVNNAAGGAMIEAARTMSDSTSRVIEMQKAMLHLKRAIDVHPNYKNAHLLLGNAHYYLDSLAKAIEFYDKALQIDPQYLEAISNRAIAYRDLGRWYGEKRGDLTNALHYLQRAIAVDPDDYETNRLLGIAYGNSGQASEAIKYFLKALSIKPEDGWTHYNLGLAYLSAGDTINAKDYITKAKALNPEIK
ncbi:MAG: tetratricopeptide repeat protein [Saprospiraceae bacterium]|nr:tetratricopeptide repeat protein [Saprospiraceae bacterium]